VRKHFVFGTFVISEFGLTDLNFFICGVMVLTGSKDMPSYLFCHSAIIRLDCCFARLYPTCYILPRFLIFICL
jgi:hypothetical protein